MPHQGTNPVHQRPLAEATHAGGRISGDLVRQPRLEYRAGQSVDHQSPASAVGAVDEDFHEPVNLSPDDVVVKKQTAQCRILDREETEASHPGMSASNPEPIVHPRSWNRKIPR